VLGPKLPSTAPGLNPARARSCCISETAGPDEPKLSIGCPPLDDGAGPDDAGARPSAPHVWGPTTPSCDKPLERWNATTAARVLGPKAPSEDPGSNPAALNAFCSVTTAGPRDPWARVGSDDTAAKEEDPTRSAIGEFSQAALPQRTPVAKSKELSARGVKRLPEPHRDLECLPKNSRSCDKPSRCSGWRVPLPSGRLAGP